MAYATIKIETEGPAQTPTLIMLNGEDVTRYVHHVETTFDTNGAPSTALFFRGAPEITHDPDTIPYREHVDFQPDEPVDDEDQAKEREGAEEAIQAARERGLAEVDEGDEFPDTSCTCGHGDTEDSDCPVHGEPVV